MVYLPLAPIWGKTLVSAVYLGTLLCAVRAIYAVFPLAIQREVTETWAFRRRLIFQMACLVSVIVIICELYGMHAILVEDAVTYHVHYTWSIFLKKFVILPFMILVLTYVTFISFDKNNPLCFIEEIEIPQSQIKKSANTTNDLVVNETRWNQFQSKERTLLLPLLFLYLLFIASDIASECLNLYLFRRSEHITIGGHV